MGILDGRAGALLFLDFASCESALSLKLNSEENIRHTADDGVPSYVCMTSSCLTTKAASAMKLLFSPYSEEQIKVTRASRKVRSSKLMKVTCNSCQGQAQTLQTGKGHAQNRERNFAY